MELQKKIDADLKEAMKSGAREKVSTLRMLNAALKNKQIEKKQQPLTEEEIIATVRSQIKQRKDAIEQFTKGRRQDLADKEADEIGVLEAFLPQQLSREELEPMVRDAIAEAGAHSAKDMGKVMKVLMPMVGARADGKLLSELVKNALG